MNNQERLIKLTESIEKTKEIIRLNKNLGDSTVIDYWELWLDQQESARNDLIEQIKQENKSMDVKFTLWDAVEHNQRIELLLTRLEDEFKELKQKRYNISVTLQNKLKEIDKQINTLLEEQFKLNNQEDKPMKIEHEGYVLTLEITDDGKYIETNCDEIGFKGRLFGGQVNYQAAIERFKGEVDRYLAQKELDEQKKKEAREIPDLLKSIDEKLDSMRQVFQKSGLAFNIFRDKKEPKKESSSLSLTYKGYRMEIVNTINYEGRLYFTGKCEIMNFDKSSISITSLIEDFEKTVDVVLFMNK